MPKLILFADLKLREKNSSVNTRFKIFVMGFRARKIFRDVRELGPRAYNRDHLRKVFPCFESERVKIML